MSAKLKMFSEKKTLKNIFMILSPKKVRESLLLGSSFANYLAVWLTYSALVPSLQVSIWSLVPIEPMGIRSFSWSDIDGELGSWI